MLSWWFWHFSARLHLYSRPQGVRQISAGPSTNTKPQTNLKQVWVLEANIYITLMHLADAFIQSNLQCIQAIHFSFIRMINTGFGPTGVTSKLMRFSFSTTKDKLSCAASGWQIILYYIACSYVHSGKLVSESLDRQRVARQYREYVCPLPKAQRECENWITALKLCRAWL